MAIFDPNTLVFSGEEVRDSADAVYISAFALPEVNKLMNIVSGIVAKKQIAIVGRFSGLLGKGTGRCKPTERNVKIPLSQKLWDPVPVSDRLGYCWNDLEETFYVWGLKKGIEKPDLTGTDFMIFIEELITQELMETWLRIAWFNDTDAELVDDGGVITDGTDLDFFNKIDGLWKQIFAIVAATPARKTAGLATKNAAATYLLQEFNSTDTTNKVVSTMLQNLRFNADMRLRGKADSIIVVTQSVADQYERELLAYEVPYSTDRLENGIIMLKSGGITIYAFDFWDRIIREYFDNGTTYYLPHRALLYDPANIQVGTEDEATLTKYDVFYDKKDQTTYVDFLFMMDAKIILDHEIQAAY